VACTTCTSTYNCDMCPCGLPTHKKLTFYVSHTFSHGVVQCVYGEKGVHETLSYSIIWIASRLDPIFDILLLLHIKGTNYITDTIFFSTLNIVNQVPWEKNNVWNLWSHAHMIKWDHTSCKTPILENFTQHMITHTIQTI
jgi:hypothetical protein